jgi:hypothetical protein
VQRVEETDEGIALAGNFDRACTREARALCETERRGVAPSLLDRPGVRIEAVETGAREGLGHQKAE